MVLSNAERQKRFRERLKAAARGDDLAERAAAAVEAALKVVWDASHRGNLADLEEYADLAAWKSHMASKKYQKSNGPPAENLRQWFSSWEADEVTPDEHEILRRAIDLIDAVSLRHGQDPN